MKLPEVLSDKFLLAAAGFLILSVTGYFLFDHQLIFLLHFLLNGTGMFIIMGLTLKIFERVHGAYKVVTAEKAFVILVISCIPVYFLHMPLSELSKALIIIAAAGSALQFYGAVLFYRSLINSVKRLTGKAVITGRILLILFLIKYILDIFRIIPGFNK